MPTASEKLRSQLRERHAETKGALADFTRNAMKTENGGIRLSSRDADEFRRTLAESKDVMGMLTALGEHEEIEQFLAQPAGTPSRGGSAAHAVNTSLWTPPGMDRKSIGEAYLDSEEWKGRRDGYGSDPYEVKGDLSVMGMERKDIYTAAGGTLTNFAFGQTDREPMMQRPYRSGRVRDLFPSAGTNASLIEYVRVLGYLNGQNNAAMIPERTLDNSNFGAKPQTALAFEPAQAPVRTIAHWEVAHRNTLDDEPQLRSIIDTELLYGLRLVEDDQILNGDGTGQNLLGLLQQPGIQSYPGSPIPTPSPVRDTDTTIDAVRRAATRVMLAYYEPTGVIMHPFDWEEMETTKNANHEYLLAVNVSVGAQARVWQMPVITTPAMQQGKALCGAFGLATKIYDRQQSNIRVAEQHADLMIRNAILVLAEQRLGLTVSRPEALIEIDLATGSSLSSV